MIQKFPRCVYRFLAMNLQGGFHRPLGWSRLSGLHDRRFPICHPEQRDRANAKGRVAEGSWFSLTTDDYRNYPRLSAFIRGEKAFSLCLCVCVVKTKAANKKPPALWRELAAGLGLLTSNRYTTASYCGMARNPWRMN